MYSMELDIFGNSRWKTVLSEWLESFFEHHLVSRAIDFLIVYEYNLDWDILVYLGINISKIGLHV